MCVVSMTKIAIIGAGQQGTSIARALLSSDNNDYEIKFNDINIGYLEELDRLLNFQTENGTNLEYAVKDADIVILATPMS